MVGAHEEKRSKTRRMGGGFLVVDNFQPYELQDRQPMGYFKKLDAIRSSLYMNDLIYAQSCFSLCPRMSEDADPYIPVKSRTIC